MVVLEVEDHGVGFPRSEGEPGNGADFDARAGRTGERANRVSGPRAGGGALVRLTVPLSMEEAHAALLASRSCWWTITAWCAAASAACWRTIRISWWWARRAMATKPWTHGAGAPSRRGGDGFRAAQHERRSGHAADPEIGAGNGGADAEHALGTELRAHLPGRGRARLPAEERRSIWNSSARSSRWRRASTCWIRGWESLRTDPAKPAPT